MKKETLVLLTGMMCDERLWKEQLDAPILQNFSFFLPKSESFYSDSIEKMARNILSEIPSEKFFVMGLSMGGIVLMEIYRQAKDRVLGIVLADTNHKAETSKRQIQRTEDLKLMQKMGLKKFVIEKMKVNYLSEQAKNKKEIYQLVVQMAENLGTNYFKKQSIALKNRRDYTDTMRTIDCPTLILCGEQDQLCPVSRHLEMKELIANTQLEVLENTGHLSCLESPEKFNRCIKNYF
jgi:pimeloyl-ACP methyl ester carboxylesterase